MERVSLKESCALELPVNSKSALIETASRAALEFMPPEFALCASVGLKPRALRFSTICAIGSNAQLMGPVIAQIVRLFPRFQGTERRRPLE